jgi:hypothetical protein
MALNQNLVQHGTAGGTAINVDVSRIESSAAVYVTLSAAYTTLCPPGMPRRPGLTGVAVANLDYPKTIASGTRIALLAAEAAALVAAGKAAYS